VVDLDRAEKVAGLVAGVTKGVAERENEKQKSPGQPQPGLLDVWRQTYNGMAQRVGNAAKDPLGAVTAPLDAAKNAAAGLTGTWQSASMDQAWNSASAQAGELGKGLQAIGSAKGPLATVGATFAFLTSIEQLLSTFVSVIPFPAFPALRILDMDVGLPHAHMHPPNFIPPAPPVPLPSTGPVIPIPILSGASKTLINMMPAARCGDMGLGIWCGGYFPMYEVFLGSSSVWIEGARASRLAVDITKHCIFTSPKPSDPPVGPMIGFTIMGSPNVLIGGVPMPSLLSFAMGLAIKGMIKGLSKAVKSIRSLKSSKFSRAKTLADEPAGKGGKAADAPDGGGQKWSEAEIKAEWAKTKSGKEVLDKLPPSTKFKSYKPKGGEKANAKYSPKEDAILIPEHYTSKQAAPTAAHEATHADQVVNRKLGKKKSEIIEMEVEAKNKGLDVYDEMGKPDTPYDYTSESKMRAKDQAKYDEAVREKYKKHYGIK
jgi:uncharacterized Zn-binding protein involved in type VI secretion